MFGRTSAGHDLPLSVSFCGRPFARTVLFCLVVCWSVAYATQAYAHGRPPQVYQVLPSATDGNDLAFAATFGLAMPDGARVDAWRWSCASAQGRVSSEDPTVLAVDGGYLAATFRGLMRLDAGGCRTEVVDPAFERVFIDVQRGPDGAVWALTSDGGDTANGIFVSHDDGLTFEARAAEIEVMLFERLRISPSDPQVMYLSGANPATADRPEREMAVFRSGDGGATWTRFDVPRREDERAIFLLEVDPDDPMRLYAYVSRQPNAYLVPERVIRSEDGGVTWEDLFSIRGNFGAFALHGGRVYIGAIEAGGFDDPDTGEFFQPPQGLWGAAPGGTFEHLQDAFPVACLRSTAEGLWACSSSLTGPFDVGRSQDGGRTFEARFSLEQLSSANDCGGMERMYCAVEDRDLKDDYDLNICVDVPCTESAGGGCQASESSTGALWWAFYAIGWVAVRRRMGGGLRGRNAG